MDMILLVTMLAITVEALVEYVKTVFEMLANKEYRKAILQGAAIVIAVLLAFSTSADFYTALGVHFSASWIGPVLTGIFLSRGANFVSDLIKRLQGQLQ